MITAPPDRTLTQGDTGEPLGPDSPQFAHLRGFAGQVKGVLPEGILKQMELRRAGSVAEVARHLLPPFRAHVEGGVVPSDWYPETFMCAVVRAQYRVFPPRALPEEIEFAHGVFTSIAKTYHHLFFRMAGPTRLLRMAAMAWGLYHTVGSVKVDVSTEHSASLTFAGNPALLEPGYAEGSVASMWGAAEMAGAKGASVAFRVEPPDRMLVDFSW